jgi:hypothetical protein
MNLFDIYIYNLSLLTGTVYKMDLKSNWWIHCLTSNYLRKWYIHTIVDIQMHQEKLELEMFQKQAKIEKQAIEIIIKYNNSNKRYLTDLANLNENNELINNNDNLSVNKLLQEYQDEIAAKVKDKWWEFFYEMTSKYRDIYKVVSPNSGEISVNYSL